MQHRLGLIRRLQTHAGYTEYQRLAQRVVQHPREPLSAEPLIAAPLGPHECTYNHHVTQQKTPHHARQPD